LKKRPGTRRRVLAREEKRVRARKEEYLVLAREEKKCPGTRRRVLAREENLQEKRKRVRASRPTN